MTKITFVRVADNFDNAIDAIKTEIFVWRGVAYTVDLGVDNLAMAETDFGRYVAVADRIGPATVTVDSDGAPQVVIKPRTKAKTVTRVVPHGNTDGQKPGTAVSHHNEPADEFPPSKDYLHVKTEQGPEAHNRRLQGKAWRNEMRQWLRDNGWPHLGNAGVVPQAGIDQYWEHLRRIRADRMKSV